MAGSLREARPLNVSIVEKWEVVGQMENQDHEGSRRSKGARLWRRGGRQGVLSWKDGEPSPQPPRGGGRERGFREQILDSGLWPLLRKRVLC